MMDSGSTSLRVNVETTVPSNRIQELFEACDTKGNGSIGPEEFFDLCQRFGIGENDSTAIFVDLDHDGDGQIDLDDFRHGFTDFLTPGSRRGSFQIKITDGSTAIQQLMEMELRHASAQNAWKHFIHNVDPTIFTSTSVDSQKLKLSPVLSRRESEGSEASYKLEKTLKSLMSDVQNLHEDYRTLESSFRREREAYAAQLAILGEELDSQLARAEAKAKDEARQEAQRQMDSERKKINEEMESRLSTLKAQLKTFEKVQEWLSEESRRKAFTDAQASSKHSETESENRELRTALLEAEIKATLLQSQLTQKRTEYLDLYQEFHSEHVAATEYRNQRDLMQTHLSVLSQANRVLSDANDCLSNSSHGSHASPLPPLEDKFDSLTSTNENEGLRNGANIFTSGPPPDVTSNIGQGKRPPGFILRSFQTGFLDNEADHDSGRDTLFEELRAESESSPLPSGKWSDFSSNTPEGSPVLQSKSLNKPNSSGLPNFMTSLSPGHGKAMPHRTFKVILAGDAAVGKTSFIERACHGHFSSHLSSTIGVDFRVKMMEIDGHCIALQLWDTAGQERFRSLTKSYFRRADGVILMYDVSCENTFLNIRQWIQDIEEGAGRKLPVVICANKVDLRADWFKGGACVTYDEGFKLSREYGSLFTEVSPKTGYKVMDTLLLLTVEMSAVEDAELRSSVFLSGETSKAKRSCCATTSTNTSLTKTGD